MESGSLLQDALSRQAEHHDLDSHHALCLDIFLLPSHGCSTTDSPIDDKDNNKQRIQELLQLADLAKEMNHFFQQATHTNANNNNYQWHAGGDGPVFGIHASDGIPHLRSICRYGANVADEWAAIGLVLQFCQSKKQDIVVECWDVQDGQILLIESADVLPLWVDRIGPEACRHRCWIQQGKIKLIAPKNTPQATDQTTNKYHLGLGQALEVLRYGETNNCVIETPQHMQQAIFDCILQSFPGVATKELDKSNCHKAAIAVPRSVAVLIQERPDLVNAAIVAFANHALYPINSNKTTHQSQTGNSNSNNIINCEDWVWTTHFFSRTNYAMLRTIVSPTWKTEAYIPKSYQSVELRRVQRQCAVEATPHLRNAVQLGVRLVAGFNCLLQQEQHKDNTSKNQDPSLTLQERRIYQYWPRLLEEDLTMTPKWLLDAWQAGPSNAQINLENILQCPVVYEELELQPDNITPLSHPEKQLSNQIRHELRKVETSDNQWNFFVMPRQDQVDNNEDWMVLSPDTVEEQMEALQRDHTSNSTNQASSSKQTKQDRLKEQTVQLDTMLDSFQSFMVDKSGLEGVSNTGANKSADGDNHSQVHINPRVFLHLLEAVLDPSTTAESISLATKPTDNDGRLDNEDDFFSRDDYETLLPASDEGESDDDDNLPMDTDVVELMAAMDQELKGTAAAAAAATDDSDLMKELGASGPGYDDNEMADQAQILTNLLQSLDAGAGGPGPVQSMMMAMGREAPLVSSLEDAEADDEIGDSIDEDKT